MPTSRNVSAPRKYALLISSAESATSNVAISSNAPSSVLIGVLMPVVVIVSLSQ